MHTRKRKIFQWLKIIIIIYCSIGIALYYLQDKFLFHPKKLPADHIFKFKQPFAEVLLPMNKDDTLSIVKFFPGNEVRRGVVLYYHGNMENIEHYAVFAEYFTSHGYEVWMEDYPGFGKSTGMMTEDKLYKQALEVYKMASAKYTSDSIIIYGKSLGTGIATYVASVSDCKQLILETPYYSIPDLFNSYSFIYPSQLMSEYKISTWKYLQDVTEPVTIFHGSNDKVIFYKCAVKLKKYLKPGDAFITIKNGGHNNLAGYPQYIHTMDSLLK